MVTGTENALVHAMRYTAFARVAVASAISIMVYACRDGAAVVRESSRPTPRPAIATLDDFDRFAAEGNGPFEGLSQDAIAEIRAGLVLDENGVERYDYDAIARNMTMEQYDALLSLFDVPDDPNAPPCPVRGYEPFVTSTPNVIDHAPIRTLADFDRVLMSDTTPLNKLSPVAVRRLRDSLTVTELGIGGLKYFEIENELSPEDFQAVMRLFFSAPDQPAESEPEATTVDPELELPPVGVPDMYCEARGTCGPKLRRLCNLNTC